MIPFDMLIPIVAANVHITPTLYCSIYNIGQTHLFVNFATTAALNRTEGNVEIPPGGLIPNLKMGISDFSMISRIVPGRVLILQDPKPMELASLTYDNNVIKGDFNYTAVNDNVNVFFTQAAFVALGGTRKTVIVVEAVTNDVLLSFNGTPPVRIGLVGDYLAAGDVGTYVVDSFVDLLALNVVALSNVNIRGAVYGV